LREIGLAGGVAQERASHQDQEGGGEGQSFHRYRNFIMAGRDIFLDEQSQIFSRRSSLGPEAFSDEQSQFDRNSALNLSSRERRCFDNLFDQGLDLPVRRRTDSVG
jgi:hypothetical protein